MNYKAQGAPKMGRNAPRHSEHNAPGSDKDPFGQRSGGRPSKAELLARMKAAQDERSKEGSDDS
ncbi:hypothetical protein [Roseovarius dicentrarchi]|uniref:hypothetical protein n=1 Tax=Roseovarius dicentrarchi TaxID=2250573 RepID=UPI000DE8550E|nr:hypothetical protein [Roseovarius dicentrarchi]